MYDIIKYNTKNVVVRWFLRLWLWKRADGIQCRKCGAEVPVEDVARFVNDGCDHCGGTKLCTVART